MRLVPKAFWLCLLIVNVSADDPVSSGATPPIPGANGWKYSEIRRVPAAEARQGVAADSDFLYVISNHSLGKYRKEDGARAGGWECPQGEPLTHLNAGIVHQRRLYCAHSNYPELPQVSSIEIWDTAKMKHAGTHSFGRADGSLTWLDRRNGRWIACFAHYGTRGGVPGHGPEWTRIVELDDEWRETGGWVLPASLIARLGVRGFSSSGGAFGPGGFLFITGHDNPELYVLAIPEAGAALKWTATIPITAQGQAFGWDPRELDVLYTISKNTREVIVGRVQSPERK